jgi:hypothetical protein
MCQSATSPPIIRSSRPRRQAPAPGRIATHSPGRDLAHRSHKLHAPLRHSSASFGDLEELTYGPTDIGFDGAFKHLLWRKLRVDLVKSRKHILNQQLDARTLLRAMEFRCERRLHRAAAFVSEHHEQLRLEVRACVLEAAKDFRRHNVARHTNDEQVAEFRIENQSGWTDGRNVRIEYRFGSGDAECIRKYPNWWRSRQTSSWPLAVVSPIALRSADRIGDARKHDRHRASKGATGRHIKCACGNPCSKRTAGPDPKRRRKIRVSSACISIASKSSNIVELWHRMASHRWLFHLNDRRFGT